MESSWRLFCILCTLMMNISTLRPVKSQDEHLPRHGKEHDDSLQGKSHHRTTKRRWNPLEDEKMLRNAANPETSLKNSYLKALHYALHQFWELKIHIYRIEEEFESLKQNKVEMVSLTEPLKYATDAINRQFDELAQKMTQNVTLETLVDPIGDLVVESISECFAQMNYSLLVRRPEIENHCNFSDLLSEVNSAHEKVNVCHAKTCRYITQTRERIWNARGQQQSGIPVSPHNQLDEEESRDPPQYSTQNYGYSPNFNEQRNNG